MSLELKSVLVNAFLCADRGSAWLFSGELVCFSASSFPSFCSRSDFLLRSDRSPVSVRDPFRSILEIRCVSVESEAGFWFVDPSLSGLVFFCALEVSINPSAGTISSSYRAFFLPLFSRWIPTFLGPASRTVRCVSGGRSATGRQSGRDRADSPLLFFCPADSSWRTVYSETFRGFPGAF